MKLRMLARHVRKHGAKWVGPNVSGMATLRRPRNSPVGRIVSLAVSISALALAAWSLNVIPASVSAAPRVVRARSWTPSSASTRRSRRLTIDLEMPSRRAAADTPRHRPLRRMSVGLRCPFRRSLFRDTACPTMALPHHQKEQHIASRQRHPLAHVSREPIAVHSGRERKS